jgi:dTDP-4-dehydrorhamnose reductase
MPNIKTILVTGQNGQLGQSLKALALKNQQYQFTFTGRNELDLSDPKKIAAYFEQNTFDLIINCAAYTAVDKAEEQQVLADTINHLAVKQLAETAQRNNSILIHISTDYVFDGTGHKPYTENATVNPQNIYGSTKLKGEQAIQQVACDAVIIRTSWVYSEYGNNFVKTMLRLGADRDQLNVIFDQVGSPTYATDLAMSILKIIDSYHHNQTDFLQEKVSIYHYSNEGVCSWYDFAKAIFQLSNTQCAVFPIETTEYPTPAKRPYYSLLNKAKIKQQFQLNIPYWKDSLQDCLNKLQ